MGFCLFLQKCKLFYLYNFYFTFGNFHVIYLGYLAEIIIESRLFDKQAYVYVFGFVIKSTIIVWL